MLCITGEKPFSLYTLNVGNVGRGYFFSLVYLLYFYPVYSTALKPHLIFVMFTELVFRKTVPYITDFHMQKYLLLLLFPYAETVRDNSTMLVIVKFTVLSTYIHWLIAKMFKDGTVIIVVQFWMNQVLCYKQASFSINNIIGFIMTWYCKFM